MYIKLLIGVAIAFALALIIYSMTNEKLPEFSGKLRLDEYGRHIKHKTSQDENVWRFYSDRKKLLRAGKLGVNNWDPAKFACPRGFCPGLGQGFDLREIDIYAPESLKNGAQIFGEENLSLEGRCVTYNEGSTNINYSRRYNSTEEIIRSLSSETNLNASAPIQVATLSASVEAVTGHDAERRRNIQTARNKLSVSSGSVMYLNNDRCRSQTTLDASFMRAFKNLGPVFRPGSAGSWVSYNNFLQTWGTHVVTSITYGSTYETWASEISDDKYTAKKLQLKLCATAAIKSSDIDINGCTHINNSDLQRLSNYDAVTKTVINGGNEDTRRELLLAHTSENIKAFLRASGETSQGISFQFTPIWVVLNGIFSEECKEDIAELIIDRAIIGRTIEFSKLSEACKDQQRNINLRAAFGRKAFNCNTRTTSSGDVYQEFKVEDSLIGLNNYACWVGKTGCVNDGACKWGKLEVGCICRGGNCIHAGREQRGVSETFQRDFTSAHTNISRDRWANSGENRSCVYERDAGVGRCRCNREWDDGLGDRNIWTTNDAV